MCVKPTSHGEKVLFNQQSSVPRLTEMVKEESVSHSVLSDSLRPMGCNPPGYSSEILQARILEWVDIPSSRGSS